MNNKKKEELFELYQDYVIKYPDADESEFNKYIKDKDRVKEDFYEGN